MFLSQRLLTLVLASSNDSASYDTEKINRCHQFGNCNINTTICYCMYLSKILQGTTELVFTPSNIFLCTLDLMVLPFLRSLTFYMFFSSSICNVILISIQQIKIIFTTEELTYHELSIQQDKINLENQSRIIVHQKKLRLYLFIYFWLSHRKFLRKRVK